MVAPDRNSIRYLGLDPGASGGLACIGGGKVYLTPTATLTLSQEWEWVEVYEQRSYSFSLYGEAPKCYAVVEKVGGYTAPRTEKDAEQPNRQPGHSMFKFGASYGALLMALVAAGIPYDEVAPQTWQNALGVVKRTKGEAPSRFKSRLKQLAQELFPNVHITLQTCDALLLAEYCHRKHEGTL